MPASMQDIEQLHLALDEAPSDQHLRLVLADAVEERGDPLGAEALRWLAAAGKRPMMREPGYFLWLCLDTPKGRRPLGDGDESRLPARLLCHLLDSDCRGNRDRMPGATSRYFGSRRDAEEAVMRAWALLPDAERARLVREARA